MIVVGDLVLVFGLDLIGSMFEGGFGGFLVSACAF